MIGKQIKGKSFRGLLNYLFGKEGARLIGGNMEGTDPRELAAEFRFSRQLNPKVNRAVYHASLSLPYTESLDDDTWHEVAQKYLLSMGFNQNQYVVVRHTDRNHDHAHIVASRIRLDGSTVSDSWDYHRSEAVIRNLEQEYNLQSVQPSWKKDRRSQTTGERRQLARTGEESVRVKLQRSLDSATQKHTTMPELIERSQQQGINVRIGYTRTGKVKGISYELNGVAFSGTNLGKAYTFPGLQKHRGVDYNSERDDERIKAFMRSNTEPMQVFTSSNSLPPPDSKKWEQVRLLLNQHYHLPNSLLLEMHQKGWLYANQEGQPVFVERTLDDILTQVRILEHSGEFAAIPINVELTKNSSFWIATDASVERAVLVSDPIEVLSIVALEFTIDKKKRKPTLYWSMENSQQLPKEFLRSLDSVVVALKDDEKVDDFISSILTELPTAQRVSPGIAGWNDMMIANNKQLENRRSHQSQGLEL